MFAIRLALFISLLYGYHVIALEGPGICPHGGQGSSVTSDQGGGLDPDGRPHTDVVTPDAGPRIDPEG